ncbi:glycine betaine ABC transporter substrate-binding protein [Candidatus Parabeggiatoa sp. HSG14]|uniref:ABC transporter permease/substrate-binding protein n=1 Tax=Candidatus Parabeggiatoa sp. HSG14 TaxID=3055593 RepID=UPI0025A72204|nr:glycine betaine ABC transporter substrate-binding protein [Thiotrichales bacterium HSG14]
MKKFLFIFMISMVIHAIPLHAVDLTIKIGSKTFTENVILGELIAHLVNHAEAKAAHQQGLGGTQILWNALLRGEIDIYPDYTGTIRQEMFAGIEIKDFDDLRKQLSEKNIRISEPLGFNNTYALAMKKEVATKYGIRKVSDLQHHPLLKFGFGNEFMDRQDGWQSLRERYQLPQTDVKGLDHNLAYRGLDSGAIDVTDGYSTDAEIAYYDLQVLEDDRQHFPKYDAVLLYRADLQERVPQVVTALQKLAGNISETEMVKMNARAKLDKIAESRIAADFLETTFAINAKVITEETVLSRFYKHTIEHLILVVISVFAAIVVSIPLGILAAKTRLGQIILGSVGIIQTIPSLALLVFMIPLLGIGNTPAIAALFLYSLLPIVRNTYAGLHDISPQIRESAYALGLSPWARLRLVELPLASRSIFAGIKTSAIINIGFATLGALIGAGGYGQPILTGIRLDDMSLILQGAIPAAGLALLVQGIFELAEKVVVPKGLQIKSID